MQLWDTAGTERFRSVSRSYYRGAAGAILVYDLTSHASFDALPTFLNDARALASPDLTLLLAGNKLDLTTEGHMDGSPLDDIPSTPHSASSRQSTFGKESISGSKRHSASIGYNLGSRLTATVATEGQEVTPEEALRWASRAAIPVSVEVSAFTGEGVEEIFARLAAMILTKIELGEIDPGDPMSGIQYGDGDYGGWEDAGSVKSAGASTRRKGRGNGAMREWEAVFRFDGAARRRRGGCC